MADMRKVEGNAHAEKRKLDQANSADETFKQKPEVEDSESEGKRQKLETPPQNETQVVHPILIGGEMEETGDGLDPKNAEGDDEDAHLDVEAVQRRRRYTAEEKGKAVLIEVSDEEESYDDDDDSSSEDSDSDFSDGLDSDSEDIPS